MDSEQVWYHHRWKQGQSSISPEDTWQVQNYIHQLFLQYQEYQVPCDACKQLMIPMVSYWEKHLNYGKSTHLQRALCELRRHTYRSITNRDPLLGRWQLRVRALRVLSRHRILSGIQKGVWQVWHQCHRWEVWRWVSEQRRAVQLQHCYLLVENHQSQGRRRSNRR